MARRQLRRNAAERRASLAVVAVLLAWALLAAPTVAMDADPDAFGSAGTDRTTMTSYVSDRTDRTSYVSDRTDRTSYGWEGTERPTVVAHASDGTVRPPAMANAPDGTARPYIAESASDRAVDPCPTAGGEVDDGTFGPRIVEVYPNPTTEGNVGEYLVIDDPADEPESLTLSDGYASVRVPAERPSGRVAASVDPAATAELTDDAIVELEGHVRLAADGDELTLANETGTIDAIAYDRAPEGEIWYRSSDAFTGHVGGDPPPVGRGDWWPRDATCRPASTYAIDEATAFVLPDSPELPVAAIADADERIRLAGYTVTDGGVATALEAALDRGVRVEVLVEAGPVGGLPAASAPLLSSLDASGATVRAIGGEGDRYGYHHAKYAVIDDRVLVTTENWKPAGVGGASSRGWGAIVDDAELAADLGAVFDADLAGHDVTPWETARRRATFVEDDVARGTFERRHEARTVDVSRAELLLSPDNAEERLLSLIDGAEDSLRIVQVGITGPDFVLLRAVLDAARDGVSVRILLSDSWYVADENRALADRLEAIAEREDLPLAVRLADGEGRFEKIHAKGLVVDGETAVIGSQNWNDRSLRENREVALVLHGEAVGTYYADVFDADWKGDGGEPFPLGLALAVGAAMAVVALLVRRSVRFAPPGTVRSIRHQPPVTIESAGTGTDRDGRATDVSRPDASRADAVLAPDAADEEPISNDPTSANRVRRESVRDAPAPASTDEEAPADRT